MRYGKHIERSGRNFRYPLADERITELVCALDRVEQIGQEFKGKKAPEGFKLCRARDTITLVKQCCGNLDIADESGLEISAVVNVRPHLKANHVTAQFDFSGGNDGLREFLDDCDSDFMVPTLPSSVRISMTDCKDGTMSLILQRELERYHPIAFRKPKQSNSPIVIWYEHTTARPVIDTISVFAAPILVAFSDSLQIATKNKRTEVSRNRASSPIAQWILACEASHPKNKNSPPDFKEIEKRSWASTKF
jgi:hypothetical protein